MGLSFPVCLCLCICFPMLSTLCVPVLFCTCVCLPACLCAYALVRVCGCVTLCVVPFVHNDMHDIIFDCEPLILQSLKIVPSPHNLFLDGWCNIVNTSGRYFRSD